MSLPVLTLKKSVHKDAEVIQLHFQRSFDLPSLLRPAYQVTWSKTMNCWYTPYQQGLTRKLIKLLNNKAVIQFADGDKFQPVPPRVTVSRHLSTQQTLGALTEEASSKVEEFRAWLNSKRYSQNTIGTYTEAIKIFLRFYSSKPIVEINNDDVIKFNNQYILANHLSASFQNQIVNAIKLFFRTIHKRNLDPDVIHRPKRPKLLPNVLSKEEVKMILQALSNVKHKAMLSLVYSCGLRRSELLNLKLKDIDSNRNLIIIRQAKGRKDRIVPLSEKTLQVLKTYFEAYRPKEWVFEGQDKEGQYDESSLAAVLKQAVEKCNINKPVTLHWLRHSYATHLLENGTDLRYIQEILGHSRSTTTEIYTHVSNKAIQNVVSPFDTL